MKALKIVATVALTALLLAAGIASEILALADATLLNPGFYGGGERGAYELVGQVVVKKLTDAVLERTPKMALRTTDRRQAYLLVSQAFPPDAVADMLEKSGPDIARFFITGGDIPVLAGSQELPAMETGAVKGMLMEGIWDALPQKPSFPAFMPFTPEWNLTYGPALSQNLWIFRWYMGMSGQSLWLCLSAVILLLGLLYLVWLRERKPFFAVTGWLLTGNGLLLLALAAAVSYYFRPLSQAMAAIPAVTGTAELFGNDFTELVRTALWPFRQIFLVSSLVSLCFGVMMFTMGAERKNRVAEPAGKAPARAAVGPARVRRRGPKHMRRVTEE